MEHSIFASSAEQQAFWLFNMKPLALKIKVAIAQGMYKGIK